jgi:hypothetical protein
MDRDAMTASSEHVVARANTFKVGDHVSWNSKAGRVSGRIVRVHTKNIDHRATPTTPARTTRNTRSRATAEATKPTA